jgi:Family of unknown function (DUF5985)
VANGVYFLCALTSGLCAILLIREYMRHHTRLLLWSSLAFSCFAFSNALVFTDFVVMPDVDLSLVRAGSACLAIVFLLIGLVWTAE